MYMHRLWKVYTPYILCMWNNYHMYVHAMSISSTSSNKYVHKYILKICSVHSWCIHREYSKNVLRTFVTYTYSILQEYAMHVRNMYMHIYSENIFRVQFMYIEYTCMYILITCNVRVIYMHTDHTYTHIF